MYIEFTSAIDGEPIYITPAAIVAVSVNSDEKYTEIYTIASSGQAFAVDESPEDVLWKIQKAL